VAAGLGFMLMLLSTAHDSALLTAPLMDNVLISYQRQTDRPLAGGATWWLAGLGPAGAGC
jgi:hypothetical protein